MTPKNLLVPFDFSEYSEHALDYAVEMAGKLGATIHLLHVISIPTAGFPEVVVPLNASVIDNMVVDYQRELDKIADARRKSVPVGNVQVRMGDARELILHGAEEVGADMIVMGTHGRRGFKRALMGSVAETVVRSAPCPVLTIRAPKTSK
jgi:nucleotide-binding universal stress UspA family protein